MDSRKVSAALKKELRPLFKERGFETFTERYAWRPHPNRIDVLNFQSFNDYLAEGLGCTTYSFAVNLGCYFSRAERSSLPGRSGTSGHLPREYHCQFQGHLTRGFEQIELERRDIWYIDPAGLYLAKAAHDVRMTIVREGFAWFDTFADETRIRRILEAEKESETLWGFGAPGSPARVFLIERLVGP